MAGKTARKPSTLFKKGCAPGPGRPPLDPALRAKLITKSQFQETLTFFLSCSEAKLDEVINDPAARTLDKYVASIVKKGIAEGDSSRIEWMASRQWGKVKDQVEISAKPFAVEKLDGAQVVLGIEAQRDDE